MFTMLLLTRTDLSWLMLRDLRTSHLSTCKIPNRTSHLRPSHLRTSHLRLCKMNSREDLRYSANHAKHIRLPRQDILKNVELEDIYKKEAAEEQ